MDIPTLAVETVKYLAPALPFLHEATKESAKKIGGAVTEAGVEQAKKIWHWLLPKTAEHPALAEAAKDVAENPGDADAQGALRRQVRKLLADEPQLGQELHDIVGDVRIQTQNADASGTGSVITQGSGNVTTVTNYLSQHSGLITGIIIVLTLACAAVAFVMYQQHERDRRQRENDDRHREEVEKQHVWQKQQDTQMAEMRQIVFHLPQKEAEQRAAGQKEDPEALRKRVIEDLAKQYGLDPKVVEQQLPRVAEQLKRDPDVPAIGRANAAYTAKDYPEAERLALAAADEAQKAAPPKTSDAIEAFELAANAADARIEYARAMQHLREAEKLTDRTRDPLEWARVQDAIAMIFDCQGHYVEVERMEKAVLAERIEHLGPEHPKTLKARHRVALALWRQGKNVEAEAEYRAVLKLEEKVLGSEHPDTLRTRNNLAIALDSQGKYAEAEAEYRAVLKLQEKVLGSEHPDTLRTRNNLANALYSQGKYVEAEAEFRAVLKLREKVLWPEHPETLATRGNLANTLYSQDKYAEAEAEYRAVLKLEEKVLGSEHPNTLATRGNLGNALDSQGERAKAEVEYRAVLKLEEKVLGPEHPDTLKICFNLAHCLQAEGRKKEAGEFAKRAAEGTRKVLGAEHLRTKKYEKFWQEVQAGGGAK